MSNSSFLSQTEIDALRKIGARLDPFYLFGRFLRDKQPERFRRVRDSDKAVREAMWPDLKKDYDLFVAELQECGILRRNTPEALKAVGS